MRLLVTGGRTGYLGRHVVTLARSAGHDVVAVGSADADLRDAAAVAGLVATHLPEAVIHTAYAQSDWAVTATGAAHVARACATYDARLVLVSSDVVFSGASGRYDESAPPDPITPYGAAKAAAETATLAMVADAVVARTSLILGDGQSPHERLVHSLLGGAEGALFDDEMRCPVHVADLAAALVELASSDHRGVLHAAGADAMSRLDLGRLIARRDGLAPTQLRGRSREAAGVRGPVDVRLDSTRAAGLLTTRLRGATEFL
ncbi:sugar nucleotide-binding protein [Nocardioides sp. InS609-2]|uniref:SDR family oxidoreductase n=1 Tax=Nocardioides sp. InS609-2 TaxID=2760705 RepID=UPI0020BDF892|nr:sugar nucleotide-binding protein [Nocardioides sp. InS609-2]